MSNKMNFIRTTDSNTADKLRSEGFKEVSGSSGVYVFLNNKTIKFSSDAANHISYTNIITV